MVSVVATRRQKVVELLDAFDAQLRRVRDVRYVERVREIKYDCHGEVPFTDRLAPGSDSERVRVWTQIPGELSAVVVRVATTRIAAPRTNG